MTIARTALMAATLALLSACGGGGDQAPAEPPANGGMPPLEVNVAQVVSKEVTEWDEFTGRFAAVDMVDIRPRVAGYLTRVAFEEGAEVKKGDLLFEIDAREYEATLARALADVERAKTRVALAKSVIERSEKLVKARALSGEEYDARVAEHQQARADLGAMQAAAAQARLTVSFTRITAPIDGRIGVAMVTPGNLVDPAVKLSTLVSLNPIYVYFEGDERTFLDYQGMARRGERESSREVRSPVHVGLANEEGYPHDGELDMVDNQLDPGTGTMRARAVLDNTERLFTPGLFARVQLVGSAKKQALLIHEQAVLTDQDRKYVYVVGEGNKAMRKDVVLGTRVDGLLIVESGLDAGDQLVVNGVRKIFFPGQDLKPVDVPMNEPNQVVTEAPPAAAPEAAKG
jgi:multidrug efflux system membrane fusion protein